MSVQLKRWHCPAMSLSTALVWCVDANPTIQRTCWHHWQALRHHKMQEIMKWTVKCFMPITVVPLPRCRRFFRSPAVSELQACMVVHTALTATVNVMPLLLFAHHSVDSFTVKSMLMNRDKQWMWRSLHLLTSAWGLDHGSPIKSQVETNVKTLVCMKRFRMKVVGKKTEISCMLKMKHWLKIPQNKCCFNDNSSWSRSRHPYPACCPFRLWSGILTRLSDKHPSVLQRC